jgi:hypothetical protein
MTETRSKAEHVISLFPIAIDRDSNHGGDPNRIRPAKQWQRPEIDNGGVTSVGGGDLSTRRCGDLDSSIDVPTRFEVDRRNPVAVVTPDKMKLDGGDNTKYVKTDG